RSWVRDGSSEVGSSDLDVDGATAVDAAVPALRGVGRAGRLVRAVEAVGERDVLHDDLRIRLVDAVAGRPLARARVGEKDPALARSEEGRVGEEGKERRR